ncbi:unnamed protein product, partial [Gulo gulo]
ARLWLPVCPRLAPLCPILSFRNSRLWKAGLGLAGSPGQSLGLANCGAKLVPCYGIYPAHNSVVRSGKPQWAQKLAQCPFPCLVL